MPTKNAVPNETDDLRPEYDLSTLTGGVRGKYYERATAGTTLVLPDRDVAEAFPDGRTINQALRALIKVAHTQVRTTTSKDIAHLIVAASGCWLVTMLVVVVIAGGRK
jgi:hypothetical protein